MWRILVRFYSFSLGGSQATSNRSPPVWLNPLNWESRCGLMKMSLLRGIQALWTCSFLNIWNDSHQRIKTYQNGRIHWKCRVGTPQPPLLYFPPCPVSRWPQALAEGLKTNRSLRELNLSGNSIGDSGSQVPPLADGRGGGEGPRERQGSWRIGCRASEVAILRHVWDVWNLIHLISISILVGFLGATFGVWFFVELFSVVLNLEFYLSSISQFH